VAGTVELAVDSASRRRGLLGRGTLASDTAFIIAPSSAVHTFGMQFAVDILFAARDGRIVKVRTNVPRSRVAFALRAFAVVEMAAGEARRLGLERGVQLTLVQQG
jgi:uncharacterized membrane protein (UPF0127 family)